MKKREADQYNMLLTVENHFDSNETVWSTNVPISDAKTTFSDMISQISAEAGIQRVDSTGATMDKGLLRADLEAKGFFLSQAIGVYAAAHPVQNQEYKPLVISEYDLSKLTGADLLYFIEKLNVAAMLIIEALGIYGVTQATLTDLMDARSAFRDILMTPQEVISNRKIATDTIPVLLHQTILFLEGTMDRLMRMFKTTEPQFVNVYFNDRKIHHLGVRTLSLEVLTLNASDNTPLAGAHLEVVGKGFKRISTEKGQNRVQNLLEGNYMLEVNCLNFVPQMIPFAIMSGQTTQLIVEMEEEASEMLRD